MEKAFEFKKVVKRFPGFQLGPLDLDLPKGMVLGYIGPNGSGKTTTMHCLVGLLKAEEGSIKVFGRENDPFQPGWKLDIGYVGDVHVFYEKWSAEKNLKFFSKFYPNWSDAKAMELIKRFRLPLEKRARDLSTGNRVKLSLVSALAHSPKLLLLDEPTAGLDPVVRDELLEELYEVLQDGERAIFYSTHILSDINRLVDELVFLDEGQTYLRTTKEYLGEKWRKITFTMEGNPTGIESAVNHKIEGTGHQVISSNFQKTLAHLKRLGAKNIRENPVALEEIALLIMKGGKNVAVD